MKKLLQTSFLAFMLHANIGYSQTTINFDDPLKWTAGSAAIGSYATNHSYSDGLFSATGGDALRGGTAAQDGFPSGFGTYAWRLSNNATVEWTITIASGGINTFSVDIRRWDDSPSPDYNLEYSTDLGTNWTLVSVINNATLDNSSAFKTFSATVNDANSDIKIRLKANGTTERIMVDNFYWEPFGASTSPTVSFAQTTATVNENVGTATFDVNLTNFDTNPIDVDVLVAGGTATNGLDYTFSPVTLTFPGGANSTQSFSIAIIDDIDVEPTETIILSLSNPTNGAVIGTNNTLTISILDNDIPTTVACSELFISEYIEGSGNNKAIEIYNPSSSPKNLADYTLKIYANGNLNSNSSLVLSGILNPGQTFVVVNPQANASLLSKANVTSGVMSFTGNDAIELVNTATNTTLDIFGIIGNDPGAAGWAVGTGSSANHTLRRMSSIDMGNIIWNGSGNTEWDVYSIDTFNGLKIHESTNCGASLPVVSNVIYPVSGACISTDITLTCETYGGLPPYSYTWDLGDGTVVTTSVNTLTLEYQIAQVYSLTVTVEDINSVSSTSTFNIEAFPNPVPNFTINTTACDPLVTLTNNTIGNGMTYTYDVPTTFTQISFDATSGNASYEGTSGPFSITLNVTDINGCSSFTTENSTVILPESTDFAISSSICQNETINLVASNTIGEWSGIGVTDNGDGTGIFNSGVLTGTVEITYSIIGICGNATTEELEVLLTPTADFTFTGNNVINFTNTSTNILSGSTINWNFGDGNTSNSLNDPIHTYTSNGSYTVCLEITNGNGCVDEICKTVNVIGVSVKENMAMNTLEIYPNPSNGQFTINYPTQAQITVTNIIGKEVFRSQINGSSFIDISNMSSGTYFVTVKNNEYNQTKKIVIK